MILRKWELFFSYLAVLCLIGLLNIRNPFSIYCIGYFIVSTLLFFILCYFSNPYTKTKFLIRKLEKENQYGFDVTYSSNYLLHEDSNGLQDLNELIRTNYSKSELQKLFGILTTWKKENDFVWSKDTVFDSLYLVCRTDDSKNLVYDVVHYKRTVLFTLEGVVKNNKIYSSKNLSNFVGDPKYTFSVYSIGRNGKYTFVRNTNTNETQLIETVYLDNKDYSEIKENSVVDTAVNLDVLSNMLAKVSVLDFIKAISNKG